MNKKTIVIAAFIALIVILVIVGSVFYFNKKKLESETKDWPKYEDAQFGMSFKYPTSWNINGKYGTGDDKRVTVTNLKGGSFDMRTGETRVAFEVRPIKEKETVDSIISCVNLGSVKLVECGTEKIAGMTFKKEIMQNQEGSKTLFLASTKGNVLYQIQVFGNVNDSNIEAIFSTVSIK